MDFSLKTKNTRNIKKPKGYHNTGKTSNVGEHGAGRGRGSHSQINESLLRYVDIHHITYTHKIPISILQYRAT